MYIDYGKDKLCFKTIANSSQVICKYLNNGVGTGFSFVTVMTLFKQIFFKYGINNAALMDLFVTSLLLILW